MPVLLSQASHKTNPDFLATRSTLEKNEIDDLASCLVSLLKMAQQDYYLGKTELNDFKTIVAGIQRTISKIHNLLMSEAG